MEMIILPMQLKNELKHKFPAAFRLSSTKLKDFFF